MRLGALALLERTNTAGHFLLAAWHHPKAITWKWSLWWSWSWKGRVARWNGRNGYWQFHLAIPLLGWFALSGQPVYWKGES